MRTGFLLATLASCYVAFGQQPECTAEDNDQYYDLTPLRSKYVIIFILNYSAVRLT